MDNRPRSNHILFLHGVEFEKKCQGILEQYSQYEVQRRNVVEDDDQTADINMIVITYRDANIANEVYDILRTTLRNDKKVLVRIFPNYQNKADYMRNQDLHHTFELPEMHVPATFTGIVKDYYTRPPRSPSPQRRLTPAIRNSVVRGHQPTVSRIGFSNTPRFRPNSPIPATVTRNSIARDYYTSPPRSPSPHRRVTPAIGNSVVQGPTVSRIGSSNTSIYRPIASLPAYPSNSQFSNGTSSSGLQGRRYHGDNYRYQTSYSSYSAPSQSQDRSHRGSSNNSPYNSVRRDGAFGSYSSHSGAPNDPVYGTATVQRMNRNRTRSGPYSYTDKNQSSRRSYK